MKIFFLSLNDFNFNTNNGLYKQIMIHVLNIKYPFRICVIIGESGA